MHRRRRETNPSGRDDTHQVATTEGEQRNDKGAGEQGDKTHDVAFDIPVFVP
jgi:hypothetical protein